ncbi:MAG: M20/M25/M40 family metallo-hydrolase, partial [Victivallales bacterium]|nr:M20/M25/M40 family metallo-hydrolase [Victivallales bacterium]
MDVLSKIKKIADELEPGLIDARRSFHKYPELALLEFRTASLIAEKLRGMGCEIRIGREIMDADSRVAVPERSVFDDELRRAVEEGAPEEYLDAVKDGFTAVAAVISNGEGPVVGVRVDIDALPVRETSYEGHIPVKCGFASVHGGVMHACGHDANAATGLGLAEVLERLKDDMRGTVKIIFQPA